MKQRHIARWTVRRFTLTQRLSQLSVWLIDGVLHQRLARLGKARSTCHSRPFFVSTALGSLSNATSKVNGDLHSSSDQLQQMGPNSSRRSRFLAGGFLIAQTCGMHRSLPCRIGHKWSAITDWLATQFTTFHQVYLLCGCAEFCSWNRPIVGRT